MARVAFDTERACRGSGFGEAAELIIALFATVRCEGPLPEP